jgi:hypothetical protein
MDFQSIDSDQIAGMGNRVLLRFADGIGTRAQGAATAGDAATGRFDQLARPLQLGEDAAHHGSRDRQLLLAEQYGEFVLAPARVAQAQGQDAIGQRGRPGDSSSPPMGTVGALFQSG